MHFDDFIKAIKRFIDHIYRFVGLFKSLPISFSFPDSFISSIFIFLKIKHKNFTSSVRLISLFTFLISSVKSEDFIFDWDRDNLDKSDSIELWHFLREFIFFLIINFWSNSSLCFNKNSSSLKQPILNFYLKWKVPIYFFFINPLNLFSFSS